jgi:hypothetical protein
MAMPQPLTPSRDAENRLAGSAASWSLQGEGWTDHMKPSQSDPFDTAVRVAREAHEQGVPLKLLGGQAVRLLCPDFPHRARKAQDIDFASVSSAQHAVIEFLGKQGFQGDQRFNLLHGDRQMFFRSPDGVTTVDVIMDQLRMAHVLDFHARINRMPYTLDVTDLLLTKLQIVEINRKDVHDIFQLLSQFPVRRGDEPGEIGLDRIGKIVGSDWGWWRTVTGNLDKVSSLAEGEYRALIPAGRRFHPSGQAQMIREFCEDCPKSYKWKVRAALGERVRWYQTPEEPVH